MYKTILVGFDESQAGKAAVIEASNWIRKHGGQILLVHAVFFDTEEFGIAPEQLEKRLKVGEKICVQTKQMVITEFGIEAKYLLCEGEPHEVIIDTARGRNADLIVLGTYGRRGLNRLLMGSVTSGVIAGAPADVLVVKKPCSECSGEYGSILVPFDGSEFSRKAMTRACRLSKVDNSEITALYVIPRYEEMIDFFRTDSIQKSLRREAERIISAAAGIASAEGVEIKEEIVDGVADEKIVESVKKLSNDLIIMGSHGYSGVDRALLGSTAERVILNATCPVLVVR